MQIRITSVPAGGAPLEIREAWVGAVIPLDLILILASWLAEEAGLRAEDVATLEMVPEDDPNVGGYAVYTADAINSLRAIGANEAANWWQDFANQFADNNGVLVFGKQFCELLH